MPRSASSKISPARHAARAPDVDSIVRELREIYCVSGLRLALTIGKVVLDRIYGGDPKLWHSRGKKDQSFRKLAEHPALPFAPSTLSRAVGIYEISLRRSDLLDLPNVTSSHVRQVLGLPSAEQDRLIQQASRDEWSVLRLREEIRRLRGAEPGVPESRRAPRFARFLRTLGRGIEQAVLLEEVDRIEGLPNDETEELLRTAQALHEQSRTVIERLARHLEALGEGPAAPVTRSRLLPRGNTGTKGGDGGENAA
jgi:hypothetical protein